MAIKKIIITSLILLLCLSGTGCSQSVTKKGSVNGYSIDELKEMHVVMLQADNSNYGLVDSYSDYWTDDSITVYYDGTVELKKYYNLSGCVVDFEDELSEEDYNMLLDVLTGDFVKGTCDIEVDACDGNAWEFVYYDSEGKQLHSFSGYSYGIEPLENIQEMLYSYMPEYEAPPLYPEE